MVQFKNSNWHLLWLIPLAIVILPIVLLLLPFVIYNHFKENKRVKQFHLDNLNKTYFFYSYKNGWKEITENNIIPVLPAGTDVFNINNNDNITFDSVRVLLSSKRISPEKSRLPFIVKLTMPTPLVYSLHEEFAKIKAGAGERNEALQLKIKKYIDLNLNVSG